jgi:hypothetical protein
MWEELKLNSDGGDSGGKKYRRLWLDTAKFVFGGSLESGGRPCVAGLSRV